MQYRKPMLKRVVFGLLVMTAAPSAFAGQCAEAKMLLKGFINNIPAQAYWCDKTEDCKPYFIYAQPCDPPVILGLAGDRYVGYITPSLIPLQQKVRAVCPEPEYACEPTIPAYQCVNKVCRVQAAQ